MPTPTIEGGSPAFTFTLSPTRLSRIQALDAWLTQSATPDLAAQDSQSVIEIPIGPFTIYWTRGLSPETPPYVVTPFKGTRFLLVYLRAKNAVVVYEKSGQIWTRRGVLTDQTQMLAALPRRSFEQTSDAKPATLRQLETLRKMLDVPADKMMPPLSARMCSRLLDRIIVERALENLRADLTACERELEPVPTLAHD